MRKLFAASLLAAVLVTGCGEDADVTEGETPAATVDPVDTAPEAVTNDMPPGNNAGAQENSAAWDANNNGNFDRAEFTGYGDRGFLGWDDDNDQRLTRTEFDAGWAEAGWRDPGTAFTAFDDNNDTYLSNDEFFGEDEFGEWDANANGVLETNEWRFGAAA